MRTAKANEIKSIGNFTDNRRDIRFWQHDSIIGTFSRQDDGLIAIGRPDDSWIHVDACELQKLINDAERYWAAQKERSGVRR